MKFLKRPFSPVMNLISMDDQKKSAQVTRLLAPLVLAFMLFAFVGLTTSGQAFASTTKTCGNIVRASGEVVGYFGTNEGTLNLVQNTCTRLFHAEVICSMPAVSIRDFLIVVTPATYGAENPINEVDQTCSKTGQAIETATLAYQPSVEFCAWAAGESADDGGNGSACITHK